MGIRVNGTKVEVQFGDVEVTFDAKDLPAELHGQAIATAVGSRFAAVASSTKDKDPAKIGKRIQDLMEQWSGGVWSRGAAEPQWTAGDEKVLEVIAKLKEQTIDEMRTTLTERADELGLTLVGLVRKLKATPEVQAEMGGTAVSFDEI